MTSASRALPFVLAALLVACGDDGTGSNTVVDFSGSWTVDAFFVYTPEDIICSVTGIDLTVSQDGAALSGGTQGGTEACSQTGTDWPPDQIGALTLSGNAREGSVLFTLKQGSDLELTFLGVPVGERFDGSFQGSVFLDPFDIGDVTVTGTWSATRK